MNMCSYGCICLCGCIANTRAFSVYVCLCRGQRSNFDVLFCCCLFVLLYFGFKSSVIGLLKIFYCCVETLTMATLIKKTFN